MTTPYSNEKPLFIVSALVALVFWSGLVFTAWFAVRHYWPQTDLLGIVVPVPVVLLLLVYLAHSLRNVMRVAYLHGQAVELGPKQYPDLHKRLLAVCKRLAIEPAPAAYLFQNQRRPEAFSLHYRGRAYLALNGDLIGAFTEHQGAIDFIMGYELGWLNSPFRRWSLFVWPATVVPLLGAGYGRAQIWTRDHCGISACRKKADAAFALAAMAAGGRRWKSLSIPVFAAQSAQNRAFWMALLELISPHPWLCKRMAYLRAIATNSAALVPRRNPVAFVFAALVPRLGLRQPGGVARLLLIAAWAAIIVYGVYTGHQRLARAGYFVSGDSSSKQGPQSSKTGSASDQRTTAAPQTRPPRKPYATLKADLQALGKRALVRQRKQGDIPCAIDDLTSLKLSFSPERYAFSCDAPTVYTAIKYGEFEPGRASHILTYNWKTGKFSRSQSPAVSSPSMR